MEINTTFYRLPPASSFEGWAENAPPGFTFAVKANRYLTHLKKPKPAESDLGRFLSRIRRLGATLGPVLWQLLPRWHANPGRLDQHAGRLPGDLAHMFEFRDPDWFRDDVRLILIRHALGFCIYDLVGHECPLWTTSSTVYLRFHGPAVAYGGRFGELRLKPWAERIRAWDLDGLEVFVYFNNDLGGFALDEAFMLRRLVEGGPGG